MTRPRVVRWTELERGSALHEAALLLGRGQVVAHPTETIYGLAAAADHPEGHRALLRVKGYREPRPFLLLFDSRARLAEALGDLPPGGEVLAGTFWPGPLTLLFPARGGLPPWWSGPAGEVAARISPHAFCRGLIERLDGPVLSTSANLPGQPPGEDAETIARLFSRTELALVVNAGPLTGAPSTIVGWGPGGWSVLRHGRIPGAAIDDALGRGVAP